MIVGLDCAEPSLVLERWRDSLPTLSGLMERGVYGRLTSVIPPITVPAWSCMMASRTPGDLGVYGFRNRADHTYDGAFIADGTAIKEPRLWDLVGRAGGSSIVVGVPGTYPPRPLKGVMVSCFLTPSAESRYTYPPALRDEIEQLVGEYLFDCTNFRTEDKDDLLRQVYEMTDKRFRLAEHLLETRPWQLFALVEMGPDRMHHGFWKYMDAEHRAHEPGNAYEDAILDYHRHLDGLIARLLRHADDETVVLVVSDHGAKRLDGGIRVNEWLRREGLLSTLSEPSGVTSPREVGIDWPRTVAWGEGGYYARIFLNVRGREPEGVIAPEDYENVRDDLARRLEAIPDEQGNPIPTRVYKPEDVYDEVAGVPPDLIAIFGDLLWRSVGTIGGDDGIHTFENDTGPDDANHAQDGLYILAGPGIDARGPEDAHLLDIAPTLLDLLGLEVPERMRGGSLVAR
jgi:predicted AlkP superfamily phosphohydrolase/phosphomutase